LKKIVKNYFSLGIKKPCAWAGFKNGILFDSHFVYSSSTTCACLLAWTKVLQLKGFRGFQCIWCSALL